MCEASVCELKRGSHRRSVRRNQEIAGCLGQTLRGGDRNAGSGRSNVSTNLAIKMIAIGSPRRVQSEPA
eukprot:2806166-Alexandrium_andersonii.AAC.1